MKEKILERLQELSLEIEALLEERQRYHKMLNQADRRIKEISVIIPELQNILDSIESSQQDQE